MTEAKACPECDSTNTTPFGGRPTGVKATTDKQHRCQECGWEGNNLATREKKIKGNNGQRRVDRLKTLLDANPEEWP